jgi:alcohol dehydrogenase
LPNNDWPSFDVEPLGEVIAEPGALSRLGECCTKLAGTRVLLVTDPGLEHAGHPQQAQASIESAGLDCFVFDGVKENPTEREVRAGVAFAQEHRIDLIVAVGGGSSMDCAKGINFLLTNGGRMADYKGHGKATKPMLPSVGVPTTAGTGSEAQCYALITDEITHMKMACGDKNAAFRIAILDPLVTLSQPRGVTAVTGIDAIAHAVESFVCTKSTDASKAISLAAFRKLEPHFEVVLSEPDNLPARTAMQIGSHWAGMAIENAMLGVCHSCANPLTAHYGLTHGVAIGLMLPHVVRFNAAHADYTPLMPAETLATRLRALANAANIPATLKDAGVDAGMLPLLAQEANEQWTARFNPRPVTEREILELYQSAM